MTTQIVCRHCGEPIRLSTANYSNWYEGKPYYVHIKDGCANCDGEDYGPLHVAEPLPAPTGEGEKETKDG